VDDVRREEEEDAERMVSLLLEHGFVEDSGLSGLDRRQTEKKGSRNQGAVPSRNMVHKEAELRAKVGRSVVLLLHETENRSSVVAVAHHRDTDRVRAAFRAFGIVASLTPSGVGR